jgi:hypothetical protein
VLPAQSESDLRGGGLVGRSAVDSSRLPLLLVFAARSLQRLRSKVSLEMRVSTIGESAHSLTVPRYFFGRDLARVPR